MNRFAFQGIQAMDVRGTSLDGKAVSEEQVRQSGLPILESNVLCSIATVTPEGRAHINTAYFSYSDKLELYFLSHPGSLHASWFSQLTRRSLRVVAGQPHDVGHSDDNARR